MKNHSPSLIKQAMSIFMAMLKTKSMEVKRKANALKTRFIIFHLLHDKNVFTHVFPSNKIEISFEEETDNLDDEMIVLGGDDDDDDDDERVKENLVDFQHDNDDDDDDDDERVEENLEDSQHDNDDEVDRAADDFIRKFHEEMMIEKQESFKMYEEMLARGV